MKTIRSRFLSSLLAIIILLQTLPLGLFAAALQGGTEISALPAAPLSSDETAGMTQIPATAEGYDPEATVLFEIEEKRDRNVEHKSPHKIKLKNCRYNIQPKPAISRCGVIFSRICQQTAVCFNRRFCSELDVFALKSQDIAG